MARRLKHREATATVALTGRVRVDRRTKDLIKRLEPGEIAVIDHMDLDRVAADGLVEKQAGAVLNASPSISGRYPNGGPVRVVSAGIPLIDEVDRALLDRLRDGDVVTIDGGEVRIGRDVVATGKVLTREDIVDRMEHARGAIGEELERFAVNTLEYIRKEAELTFAPLQVPDLKTSFRGRHALVVVRGHDYREDLRALRPYINEYRPALIGVDGGADALLQNRLQPDVIIGDFDSVSDRALHSGADLVHHVHPDGRGPGREELQAAGVDYEEFWVEGTSEDAAMLLAYEAGARLIVAVGTHATMVEFLDKGRAGMSSTFLTRLRLGPMLVDAKGVSQLYEGRLRRRDLGLLTLAVLAVILVLLMLSDSLQTIVDAVWLMLRNTWLTLTGNF
jgi:uncharacterized membrane-anchored protein